MIDKMELQKLTERWNYICGGFWYIDEHHMADRAGTLGLAAAELNAFLQSIAPGHEEQADKISAALGLSGEPQPFDPLPESFEIMLRCDHSWLVSEPSTPLDPEFGSVAMAVLGREIAEMLGAETHLPEAMLRRITEVTGRVSDLSDPSKGRMKPETKE